jgi:mycothiol synthase
MKTIPVTGLPENMSARPVVMDDLEAAVAMFNACAVAEIGRANTPLHGIRNEWELPDFSLENSTRAVFTPTGEIVGYVEVWDIAHIPSRIHVWSRTHPGYQGQGIGTALMRWAEARAREALPRVPSDARVCYQTGVVSGYEPSAKLLTSLGMTVTRHFWDMRIDLTAEPEAPSLPGNIVIRSMVPQREERTVLLAARDAFRDHWGYTEQPFEEEYAQWLHFMNNDPDYDPTLWLAAWDGDQVAGVSLCDLKSHEDPEMGWIGTLGVCRPWRRQGLGVALLRQSFRELYRRGQRKVGLGVDAASLTGATRLYEQAGMRVARQYDTYEKELRPGRDLSTQSV